MAIVQDRTPTRKIRRPRKSGEIRQRMVMPPFQGNPGVVQITDGRGREKSYFVQPLACDWGQAWRLEVFFTDLDTVYDLADVGKYDLLREDGVVSCDCRGHLAHGHCKHATALSRLIETGQL